MTSGDWEGSEAPRRRLLLPVLLILAAFAVGVLVAPSRGAEPQQLTVEEATEQPTEPPVQLAQADPVVSGHWRRIAPSPLRGRVRAATAATGTHVLVWGGVGPRVYGDGAMYDLQRDSWERVPPAPLRARFSAAAVWDGDDVVVFGGATVPSRRQMRPREVALRDGAAYNPRSRTWRAIPSAPFPVTAGRLFLVDGRLYAVAPSMRARPVAVLDQGSAAWRLLPPSPVKSGDQAAAALTGDALLLWPAGAGDAAVLDVRTAIWKRVTHAGLQRTQSDCACRYVSGATPAATADIVAYDVAGSQWWRPAGRPRGSPSYVGTDNELLYLVQAPGPTIALRRDTGVALRLPTAPHALPFQPVALWTGRALFLWSGANPIKSRYAADGMMFVPGGVRGPRRPRVF